MRRLAAPTLDVVEVYTACAKDASGTRLAPAYAAADADIKAQADQYRLHAVGHSLHALRACNRGKDHQVIVGNLTKGGLKKLYAKGMVAGAIGRTYYDQLRASAPLDKCPYCQLGHVETLDHFLAQAHYPAYAVLPINLIPACMRCNTGKASAVVTAENEMSHPYFEGHQIERDAWLVSHVQQTSPVTVTYTVAAPSDWPSDLSRRVVNYFAELELAKRYSVEAASELVSISAYLRALPSAQVRRGHLAMTASVERGISMNGWKTALYAALADSSWYVDVGCGLVGS